MKKYLFWFSFGMSFVYIITGIAILLIDSLSIFNPAIKLIIGIAIILYGILRIATSYNKRKYENEA